MLTNQYTFVDLQEYKKIYLSNFTSETSQSFDYLYNKVAKPQNFYLSVDAQGIVELGLIVIPKTVVSDNQILHCGLIYGLVASNEYKGTKVVKRLLPDLIECLKKQYDFILIESDHWKIYKDFDLIDVNSYMIYKINRINLKNYEGICIKEINRFVVNKCLDIYNEHVINFGIKNYVKYDVNSLHQMLELNRLTGDQILVLPDAYAIWDKSINKVYSLVFKSIQGLLTLLDYLPSNTLVQLNDLFNVSEIDCLQTQNQLVKTKCFSHVGQIKNLLFNEIN